MAAFKVTNRVIALVDKSVLANSDSNTERSVVVDYTMLSCLYQIHVVGLARVLIVENLKLVPKCSIIKIT